MSRNGYIALDLGAESGRAMLATLENDKVALQECHRFPNGFVHLPSGYHWDTTGLYKHLVEGIKQCAATAREQGVTLMSVGVDTWGVDFGLLGKSGALLGLPYAYRDDRNPPAMQHAFDKVGQKAIYDATGIQFMPLNTLFQMVAQHAAEPELLGKVNRMLNMPDLLHYFLSGEMVSEATIASTTQMVDPTSKSNPHTGEWATELLESLGLPTHFLGKIVPAGTKIGMLREAVAKQAGIEPIDVIAPGSHDTASAVAAVPVRPNTNWLYLSSGTWSLMGAELDQPFITDESREIGFTNERGVEGKIRFLKNIAGLWLVQETRRDFEHKGESYTYAELANLASDAEPFRTLVDPAHEPFASPDDMCAKIDAFAAATKQPKPQTPGQYVRCCLESLAMTYRVTLEGLQDLLDQSIDVLHIVGGGGKNALLNQMTADATGRTVVVGPYEATAIGNALTQAMGRGEVRDLAHLRQIVRNSETLQTYAPRDPDDYDKQEKRFHKLIGK